MPAIITIAVVPFGSTLFGVPMVIADINVGILFVFAIASLRRLRNSHRRLGVEFQVSISRRGPFQFADDLLRAFARSCSHSRFSARRQFASDQVVRYQIDHGWFIAPFIGDWTNPWKWLLAIPMIISFLVFTIAIFAETNRLPFDLPEAEQELAGGYHTEYSSMKFALFFLGEYAAMITGSAVIVTLFFGGWHPSRGHSWRSVRTAGGFSAADKHRSLLRKSVAWSFSFSCGCDGPCPDFATTN